jgi:large subunit ribosomal protein L25
LRGVRKKPALKVFELVFTTFLWSRLFFCPVLGYSQMEAVLKAEARTESGSRSCQALRAVGKVPAVLYGKEQDVVSLSLDGIEVSEYFAKVAKQELQLDVNGSSSNVKIGEVQRHPITRDVLHIDFIRN